MLNHRNRVEEQFYVDLLEEEEDIKDEIDALSFYDADAADEQICFLESELKNVRARINVYVCKNSEMSCQEELTSSPIN